jgi:hypothetical protein
MRGGFGRVHGLVGLTMAGLVGCSAPEPRPWWLVEHVEPLALRLDVVADGPWATESPGARRFADPLPLDTVQVTPIIVTPDGPLDIERLDAAWVLCDFDDGTCLDDLALAGSLPACEVAEPFRLTSCLLDRGPRATFTFAVPPIPSEPITDQTGLFFWHSFRMLAGIPGVEETDACIERLRRREPMFDCIMMAGSATFSPALRVQEIMQDLGAEVWLTPEQLGERTFRNRHPEVERFFVTDLERRSWATVPSGGEVVVTPGAEISIEYLESDEDRDVAPVPEGTFDPLGQELVPELLHVTWRFGREVERSRNQGNPIVMTAPESGDVTVFAVVMDSTGPNRGLAFGWLRVRVSKSP